VEASSVEPIENTTTDAGELHALVLDHRRLGRLERLAGGFNLFETLKLTHQEIRHSNVLSWLLDPDENHGLGGAFLRAWLMQVVEESGTAELDVVAVHTAEFRNVAIRREWRHIDKIIATYTDRPEEEERYARRVGMDEIKENDYNLNITRYVSTAAPEPVIDLGKTYEAIVAADKDIREATGEHNKFLHELGLPPLP